ncbi:MAG: hypothetical protein AAF466_11985, partial [Bacteroidota bacterium]
MRQARLKKFAIRFLLLNLVYLSVKLTMDHEEDFDFFNPTSMFYYITAFILFMGTWEVNDWLFYRELKVHGNRTLGPANILRIVGGTLLILLPISAMLYYLGIFELNHICEIDAENPWLQWRIDFLRSIIIGVSVIFVNMFYHSITLKR